MYEKIYAFNNLKCIYVFKFKLIEFAIEFPLAEVNSYLQLLNNKYILS